MEIELKTNWFCNGRFYKAGEKVSPNEFISEEALIKFCAYEGIPITTSAKPVETPVVEEKKPVKRGRKKA